MRICHVVYAYFPFDPRVRKEVSALRARGHQVNVICLRDEGETKEEVVDGVRVHRLGLRAVRGGMVRYAYQYTLFLLEASLTLLRLHLRHPFRVVHVHSLPDFQVFCALPARALGASVVLDLHESMPEIFAARFGLSMNSVSVRIAQALETLSGFVADRILTVNEPIAHLLEGRGIPARKLLVVMNSPNLSPATRQATNEDRERLGLTGRTVIVYAGGIDRERDLETVIRAASIVAASRSVSLLIFGKGPTEYRERLRELARGAPKALDVLIEGWIPPIRVFELLALSEIGLAPYERNPLTEIAMPNKVFDYAATGKPMVIADLAAMREFWHGAALFYEPGNAIDLANKIERVLTDRNLATRLVKEAAAVYSRHTWTRYEGELMRLYDVLGSGRRGRSTSI